MAKKEYVLDDCSDVTDIAIIVAFGLIIGITAAICESYPKDFRIQLAFLAAAGILFVISMSCAVIEAMPKKAKHNRGEKK